LIDLLHSVNPACVNYEFVQPGDSGTFLGIFFSQSAVERCVMNAQYVISCAWKIGISVILLWEDIVEVKPNMILYFVAAMMAFCID
jgi:hypothetical protein